MRILNKNMNHADEIKAKLDIVDIIGEYLSLKAVGSNFRGLCPFHNEKTPSLMVSPNKQIWRCFGCGKGGDLISFIMNIEGLDFIEALKFLAPRAGVLIEGKTFSDNSQKNRLLQIMELSRKYYHFVLKSGKANQEIIKKIKQYLQDRGLDEAAIDFWQIGYSLDNYDDLLNFLRSKKFRDDEILAAGISFKSEKGKHFNRFRDRIMFPINDISGNTIAFTARINPFADSDKGLGKYINSPQSIIYDKSRVLFAMDKAKSAIREQDAVILVEGQMDAISCHEAGIKNVLAISGTALTTAQLNLIKRYTKNIILAFDQDLAGSTATDRSLAEALKAGFKLKIASFPSGKDPDEIIQENPEIFKKGISEAQDIMQYYIDRELKGINLDDLEQKNKATQKLLEIIAMLYNKVEQDFWLKELMALTRVDEVFLREELEKIIKKDEKNRARASSVQKEAINNNLANFFAQEDKLTWTDRLMENLLALLLKFNDHFSYVGHNLDSSFVSGCYLEFYNYSLIYYNKNNKFDYLGFSNFLKEEQREDLIPVLEKIALFSDFYTEGDEREFSSEQAKSEIIKSILEIKKDYFREAIKLENDKLMLAEKEANKNEIEVSLQKIKELNDELKKII